ncbi:hypothetical protein KY285_005134 [Solanum tuberosum]|nr:hypothetical protein KY285_005134 [Solanum tuberosum]
MEKDDSQSAIKYVVNILDKSEQFVEGRDDKETEADGEIEKGIGEEADTGEHPDVGDSHIGEEENSQSQHVTIPPPKIDKLSEQEIIELQEREEDVNMDRNIDDIGREGDLSPRQISHLNGKSKKGEIGIMGATGRDSRKLYIPWLVGGDFNTIMDEDEKLGDLPVTHMEIADFVQCTNACALNEIKFKGSSYTWWNGRIEEESIFKRLDRVFGNNELMSLIPNSEVHHLIRQGSDHPPQHVIGNNLQETMTKPFKFLNFWTKQSEFKKVVEDSWNGEEINGNPLR